VKSLIETGENLKTSLRGSGQGLATTRPVLGGGKKVPQDVSRKRRPCARVEEQKGGIGRKHERLQNLKGPKMLCKKREGEFY